MFVTRKKYEALRFDLTLEQLKNASLQMQLNLYMRLHMSANKPAPSPKVPFSKDELRTLIQLCHPDKHGGKKTASDITQKLIKLRDAS